MARLKFCPPPPELRGAEGAGAEGDKALVAARDAAPLTAKPVKLGAGGVCALRLCGPATKSGEAEHDCNARYN